MRTIVALVVATVAGLYAAGCGNSSVSASGTCFKDIDCEAGLVCLPLTVAGTDGTCSSLETKICTKVCTGDGDCTGLRDGVNQGGFKCNVCAPEISFCAQFLK